MLLPPGYQAIDTTITDFAADDGNSNLVSLFLTSFPNAKWCGKKITHNNNIMTLGNPTVEFSVENWCAHTSRAYIKRRLTRLLRSPKMTAPMTFCTTVLCTSYVVLTVLVVYRYVRAQKTRKLKIEKGGFAEIMQRSKKHAITCISSFRCYR